jgi:sec-independent protein translocase protein TatA
MLRVEAAGAQLTSAARVWCARTGYLVCVGYFETPWHIVLLLLIALLLFGGKRLPEIGRSLGSGMREFKDGITGHSQEAEQPEFPSAEPTAASGTPSEHRLAEIGRSLGSEMREFKDSISGNSPEAPKPQPELPPDEPTVERTDKPTEREET